MAKKTVKKKKEKPAKVDGGMGAKDVAVVRAALRLIWQRRSYARKLVIQRCTGFDGFLFCEECEEKTPKIAVDHINKVGDVDEGFLKRLWVSSKLMKGLCKKCHDKKTKEERAEEKAKPPKHLKFNCSGDVIDSEGRNLSQRIPKKRTLRIEKCRTCGAVGFKESKLGNHRCEFCDGTASGNPPTDEDLRGL